MSYKYESFKKAPEIKVVALWCLILWQYLLPSGDLPGHATSWKGCFHYHLAAVAFWVNLSVIFIQQNLPLSTRKNLQGWQALWCVYFVEIYCWGIRRVWMLKSLSLKYTLLWKCFIYLQLMHCLLFLRCYSVQSQLCPLIIILHAAWELLIYISWDETYNNAAVI